MAIKLFREPLLHFLLAGALLFGAYMWINRGDAGGEGDLTIQVTEREIAWLTESWSRQWQKPPSPAELQGLMVDYLREELLAREAQALGLDREDVIVRRRLAQKMNFILEDTARLAEPTDAELRAVYESDRARFDAPAQIGFVTVYFSTARRGERAADDARKALTRLTSTADADPRTLGDGSLLPEAMTDADQQVIASVYGSGFAEAVMALEPGTWQGPIESAFGLHLVRITERREGQAQPFAEIRDRLAEEWRRRSEEAAKETYFRELLGRYEIVATDSVRPLIDSALAKLRNDPG